MSYFGFEAAVFVGRPRALGHVDDLGSRVVPLERAKVRYSLVQFHFIFNKLDAQSE